jgi:hypothetical protein
MASDTESNRAERTRAAILRAWDRKLAELREAGYETRIGSAEDLFEPRPKVCDVSRQLAIAGAVAAGLSLAAMIALVLS